MKKLLPLFGAMTFMAAGPACAHEMMHDGDMMHEGRWVDYLWTDADTNKDGSISREEFLDHAGRKFDMMDANGDGMLSKSEAMDHAKKDGKTGKMHKHMGAGGKKSSRPDTGIDRVETSDDAKSNSESSTTH